jgi:hypothetical protein
MSIELQGSGPQSLGPDHSMNVIADVTSPPYNVAHKTKSCDYALQCRSLTWKVFHLVEEPGGNGLLTRTACCKVYSSHRNFARDPLRVDARR